MFGEVEFAAGTQSPVHLLERVRDGRDGAHGPRNNDMVNAPSFSRGNVPPSKSTYSTTAWLAATGRAAGENNGGGWSYRSAGRRVSARSILGPVAQVSA